jgi:hypothetical protein
MDAIRCSSQDSVKLSTSETAIRPSPAITMPVVLLYLILERYQRSPTIKHIFHTVRSTVPQQLCVMALTCSDICK